ncbi:unnamed protein product [Adineta steineri]|uniref:Uncharacterized protein n=1 Tax=Adineta steineri TaxID=433720 RepID=A0A816BRV8_9BILA|nr:unnamed protein product [Adineta steineri]CAF1612645.1 unnamed protein product [Adineta steineri]
MFGNRCDEPFNADGMTANEKKEAPTGGACMKTKTKLKNNAALKDITILEDITTVVHRNVTLSASSCPGGQDGCKEVSKDGDTATICCCTSDLCNGVSIVQQKPLIVFLTMSTLAMFAYQWY